MIVLVSTCAPLGLDTVHVAAAHIPFLPEAVYFSRIGGERGWGMGVVKECIDVVIGMLMLWLLV